MATRGRKPTPTHLKLVRGNPGKRKLPDPAKEIRPPLDEPTPPAHLSDEAKVEWGRIVSLLFQLKLMTQIDRASLAAYCQAYGRWVQAERALTSMAEKDMLTRGLMIKTTGGNLIQNPLVGTANKAMADMVRYAAEFGMTPSARTRLQNPGAGSNENPFEAFRKSAS
jgi:P27 family predicted phage terminase small subunit